MAHAAFLSLVQQVALLFPSFVILFTVRGFFQAFFARLAGDNTATYSGFLTLNPLAHIEVGGSFVLACLFALLQRSEQIGGGFLFTLVFLAVIFIGVRPYIPVPIVTENFRHERIGLFLMAIAGTVAYILVTLISMYAVWYGFRFMGASSPTFLVMQQVFTSIIDWAMFWAVISIMPIPPFDGAALLPAIFGDTGHELYELLEQHSLFIFLGLFFIPGVSTAFLSFLSALRMGLYELLMMLVF